MRRKLAKNELERMGKDWLSPKSISELLIYLDAARKIT
jgi:hypothetical protein